MPTGPAPQAPEVVVVGYGPVGQLLAGLLGRLGVHVLVLERATALHPLPRAASLDDEALRVLDDAGVLETLRADLVDDAGLAFVTRTGRELRVVDPHVTASGHPFLAFLHQPVLEAALDAAARAQPCVEVRFGAGVASVAQDAHAVTLTLADGTTLRAPWVVACDGARSAVRDALGVAFAGRTAPDPWLVVDLALPAPRPPALPMRFVGAPTRPAVSVPMGRARHRLEVQALAGEPHAALTDPARVRSLVETHLGPLAGGAVVERAVVYTFHARTATRWRSGRVLLAGDAAHVMPPFAGQGLCQGLQDATNLAWKLHAVLRGARPALLDSYEAERRPVVRRMRALALTMGAIVQTRRPRPAAARDALMTAATSVPGLRGWLRRGGPRPATRLARGALGPGGGALHAGPLPPGWVLLADAPDPAALLPDAGVAITGVTAAVAGLVLVRPDRVVFATGDARTLRAALAAQVTSSSAM